MLSAVIDVIIVERDGNSQRENGMDSPRLEGFHVQLDCEL